jgi:hypothetical protein
MTLYGKSRLMVAACLIHVFCGHIALSKSATHYRYIVCTDMTHDDDNSLIRLLHYANEMTSSEESVGSCGLRKCPEIVIQG